MSNGDKTDNICEDETDSATTKPAVERFHSLPAEEKHTQEEGNTVGGPGISRKGAIGSSLITARVDDGRERPRKIGDRVLTQGRTPDRQQGG